MIKIAAKAFRYLFPKRVNNYKYYTGKLKGLHGIEIGGPSFSFTRRGFLPVYSGIKNLDGCNFSSETVWEGSIKEGNTYRYGKKTGNQIISDGTNLANVANAKYDFLLSCHNIEHIANPIKALEEWKRVIRENGYILLVVPHKDNTFDHLRPVTTLDHLIKDYENNTGEEDDTHFNEVITLHDLSKDSGLRDKETLKTRTVDNIHNRCVHHHVFNTPLTAQLANHAGLKICDIQHFPPYHLIMLLQKVSGTPDNSRFLNPANEIFHKELFPSDKIWQ